jgi:hypothetical protein
MTDRRTPRPRQPRPQPGLGGVAGGTILRDIRIDPDRLRDIVTDGLVAVPVKPRVPLMLMPLRLEYRFVTATGRPQLAVTDNAAEMNARFAILSDLLPVAERARVRDRALRSSAAATGRRLGPAGIEDSIGRPLPPELITAKALATSAFDSIAADARLVERLPLSFLETQLLMRWYPDENFAEKGVPAPSEGELAALARLNAALGGRNWWRTEDSDVSTAWQAFAAEVGAARAVHLKRAEGQAGQVDWEARIGRIAALPSRVAIFAFAGGRMQLVGTGKAIPPNLPQAPSPVSYTGDALGDSGDGKESWLTSFGAAIDLGMGIRIADKDKVELAKSADWIVAVGLHNPGGRSLDTSTSEIEALLDSRIATGDFSFLAQDSNTNNVPDQPTEYRLFQQDILQFTAKATASERGAFAADRQAASDVLAGALGLDPTRLRQAIRADDAGFEDARAILRVIGPALLDDALDGTTVLEGVDEDAFISVLAGGVVARGALPALRFGSSAYGVTAIADVEAMDEDGEEGLGATERKVIGFLTQCARAGRTLAADAGSVRVLTPDSDDPAGVFEEIMKSNRVSTRVEVTGSRVDRELAKPITCPYVSGSSAARRPASYLAKLRTDPISTLPDPIASDLSWPLLYRLARLSLTRNTLLVAVGDKLDLKTSLGLLAKTETLRDPAIRETTDLLSSQSVMALASGMRIDNPLKMSVAAARRISRINADFASALKHLEAIASEPQGPARLEVLMMEVLDLFQHRIDAYALGLAYLKLKRDRAAGLAGLAKGYYGILGKLRPDSKTGGSDGYLLAPSTPQAVTAAVMRSAHLRHHQEKAFSVNLSSRRVRRALKLLDILSKGHSLSEALGMRGERLLHEARADAQILPLRLAFPIRDSSGEAVAASRVFDGLAFIDAPGPAGNAARAAMKKQLADDLDALSDVVMAEATHQRGMGAAEVANAWLKVMSGGMPPGRPGFLRTHRTGHASTHKVTMMRNARVPPEAGTPREIAEPTLAAMAAEAMPDLAAATIAVTAATTEDGLPGQPILLELEGDLGMRPIDLVIGGASELQVRAKFQLLRRLTEDPRLLETLNASADAASFVAGLSGLTVDLASGRVDIADYLGRAEKLRNLTQSSRPIEPGDLNAMAPAEHGLLTEAEEVAMIEHATTALAGRLAALQAVLSAGIANATAALNNFEARFLHAAATLANETAGSAAVTDAVAQAELARRNLVGTLEPIAVFGEPSLLKVMTREEALADVSGRIVKSFRDALERLQRRRARLQEVGANSVVGFAGKSGARARLIEQVAALREALDGDALPVLPPYPRDLLKTRAQFEPAVPLDTVLADWSQVRERTASLCALARLMRGTGVLPVSASATLDDADDATAALRSEEVAPRSAHYEYVFGMPTEVKNFEAIAGFVADEWTEARPSNIQSGGMAINYDSPQSEPPHCILIGIPPGNNTGDWSEEKAAAITGEAIAWMQIRALSSTHRLTPAALFPNANQVAAKTQNDQGLRIPDRLPPRQVNWTLGDGLIATVAAQVAPSQLGVSGAGITERLGFSRVRE